MGSTANHRGGKHLSPYADTVGFAATLAVGLLMIRYLNDQIIVETYTEFFLFLIGVGGPAFIAGVVSSEVVRAFLASRRDRGRDRRLHRAA